MNDLTETTRTASPNAARDLIYLASCAVNNEIPDKQKCDAMDLDAVFDFARYHIMTSIAAHALEKVTELPHCFDQAQKKAIRKLSLFDIERIKIYAALEQNGVWYLPLKGITLKSCYPKSSMREMSDNDILCDSGKMDVVKTVMEGLGYSCEVFEEFHHDVYSKPPTLEFEMHHTLFQTDDSPAFQSYYLDVFDKLVHKSGCEYAFKDEDFYIYILAHMYKHFSHNGTGLRSLLDIHVYLQSHPDLDFDYIGRELEKLQLLDFAQRARGLAVKLFGLQKLSEEDLELLPMFLDSSIYGSVEQGEYNHLTRQLDGKDSKRVKIKYFFDRIFLHGESLERSYPFFARHKWLLPALYVYRLFKSLFTRPKGILRETKNVVKYHSPKKRW